MRYRLYTLDMHERIIAGDDLTVANDDEAFEWIKQNPAWQLRELWLGPTLVARIEAQTHDA